MLELEDEGSSPCADFLRRGRVDHVGVVGGNLFLQSIRRVGQQVAVFVHRTTLRGDLRPERGERLLHPSRDGPEPDSEGVGRLSVGEPLREVEEQGIAQPHRQLLHRRPDGTGAFRGDSRLRRPGRRIRLIVAGGDYRRAVSPKDIRRAARGDPRDPSRIGLRVAETGSRRGGAPGTSRSISSLPET